MSWLKGPDGNPVIDVYEKSTSTYDRFGIEQCKSPSAGGKQCAPSGGGGCMAKPV
ncbi:uncharacterized protein RCC_05661 [Ramularia collo-cygni]|uniref:Uncharacterized protein n=1 Tax=Ramularia collo-cygni TaxID=112498 RepID=A0A2D3UZD9_9PEZI|nr:uncharacterized protein RCC_05661 [Ramularia collo-cygni]CZT19805.1 uncharacterized protein RCC_05661 [Ramularia collo-cygni]